MHKKILLELLATKGFLPKTLDEILTSRPVFMQHASDVLLFIEKLENEQILYFTTDKTYCLAKNIYIGTFEQSGQHFGFVRPVDEKQEDLYIHRRQMNGVMHGDFVAAREILTPYSKNGKTEGEIILVIEEQEKQIVGTFQDEGTFGFVIPDNRSYPDIFIAERNKNGSRNGEKVVVEITKRSRDNGRQPEGKITEILGLTGEKGVDITAIVKSYPISDTFPPEVIQETEQWEADEISVFELEKELSVRKDLRNETIITIDGETTKDFDDAISIRKTSDSHFLLGVHIADVTHYVTEDSFLDKEALKRGTSVYLPDRVIPMLPEKLSNGLCSLNPGVNRFTLSCMMKINKNGEVVHSEIFESVIKTTERMTYTDIAKIIEQKDAGLIEKYQHIYKDIQLFHQLSLILREKRQNRGSIDFDFPEASILLNENGKAVELAIRDRNEATRMIEEFMIAANETVSEFFTKKEIPFLYRIHEKPSPEKMELFLQFMSLLGQPLSETEFTPKRLQMILNQHKGHIQYEAISQMLLRSLMKAQYSTEPKGHFGLASPYYSHFTSPIRRYPDLQIHRIIKEYLHHVLDANRIKLYQQLLPDVAKKTTNAETTAFRCEMEVLDYKICEYMMDKIGAEYEGTVSGATENGIFVKLKNQAEGFLPAEELNALEETFVFDEDLLSYISDQGNRSYTFGTPVQVKVKHVDMEKRRIRFSLVK